jgi:hypothetical protein
MFMFDIVDIDGAQYKALLSDTAWLLVFDPEDPDFDLDVELAALELGFAPELESDFLKTWEMVRGELSSEGLDALVKDIAESGEKRWRWVRGTYATDWEGYDEEYVYEFTIGQLLQHLAPVIEGWLKDDDNDVVELAKFLVAIRYPNGSAIEFDLEDGRWEEESNPESWRVWSGVDRTLSADGAELVTWVEDFEREIWDPITFESEADVHREQSFTIAQSGALEDMLAVLGLSSQEAELDEKAAEEAPAPWYPSSDPKGNYGVRYEYIDREYPEGYSKPPIETPKTTIVPYRSLWDAEYAMQIGQECLDGRCDEDEWTFTLVRRLGALDVLREKHERELRELPKAEQELLAQQQALFAAGDMPPPPATLFGEQTDIWVPYYEEEDDE